MNPEPCVDIIIPVYNGAKYIPRLFVSLLNQTYNNFRLIIAYDTKTTDTSLELLISYSDKLSITIDKDCDSSLGAARNRGFKFATAEFIVHIDVDDELSPNYLSSFIAGFEKYPELDAICCTSVPVDKSNIDKWRSMNSTNCSVKIYSGDEALYNKLKWTNGVWVWMVRRDYLLKHNISSPDYSYGEDAPFVWKIIGNANRIGHIQKPLYLYWKNPSSMMSSLSTDFWEAYSASMQDITSFLDSRNPTLIPFVWEKYCIEYLFSLTKYTYDEYIKRLTLHDIVLLNKKTMPNLRGFYKIFSNLFNFSPRVVYLLLSGYRMCRKLRVIMSGSR